jgi:hypothetical protein
MGMILVALSLGGCGVGGDETITVHRYASEGAENPISRSAFGYINAVLVADGRRACGYLTKSERHSMPRIAEENLSIRAADCPTAFKMLSERLAPKVIAALAQIVLRNPTIDGSTASVEILGYGRLIHLVRHGGRWLIARDIMLRAIQSDVEPPSSPS